MKRLFFFTSSRKTEKKAQVTIFSKDYIKAYMVCVSYFRRAGYKGKPILAI